MKKMVIVETGLSDDEVNEFESLCEKSGVCPAQKIGELVHAFVLSQGVKHRDSDGTKVA